MNPHEKQGKKKAARRCPLNVRLENAFSFANSLYYNTMADF